MPNQKLAPPPFNRFFSHLSSLTFTILIAKTSILSILPNFIPFPNQAYSELRANGLYHTLLGVFLSFPQFIAIFFLLFLATRFARFHKTILSLQIIVILINIFASLFFNYFSIPFDFIQFQILSFDFFQLPGNLKVTFILKEILILIVSICSFFVAIFLLSQAYTYRLLRSFKLNQTKTLLLNSTLIALLIFPSLFKFSLHSFFPPNELQKLEKNRLTSTKNQSYLQSFIYSAIYSMVNIQYLTQFAQDESTSFLISTFFNQKSQFLIAQKKWKKSSTILKFRNQFYQSELFSFPNPQFPLLKKPKSPNPPSQNIVPKPQNYNVVLFFLESMSRHFLTQTFHQLNSKSSHFNQMTQNALDFQSIYSSGLRSNDGMEALFYSSFPPTMNFHNHQKHNNISLLDILIQNQYDVQVFNNSSLGKFLTQIYPFQIHDIPNDLELLEKMLSSIQNAQNQKKPFFFVYSHHGPHWPYENILNSSFPFQPIISNPTTFFHYYINLYHYYLESIAQFILKIQKLPVFEKTLFIITADHKPQFLNLYPKPISQTFSEEKLLFILYNPSIIKKNPHFERRVGSQLDIAPTILNLLNIQSPSMFIGQTLLSNSFKSNRFVFLPNLQWAVFQNYAVNENQSYQIDLSNHRFKSVSNPSLIHQFRDAQENIALYQNYYQFFIQTFPRKQFFSLIKKYSSP